MSVRLRFNAQVRAVAVGGDHPKPGCRAVMLSDHPGDQSSAPANILVTGNCRRLLRPEFDKPCCLQFLACRFYRMERGW